MESRGKTAAIVKALGLLAFLAGAVTRGIFRKSDPELVDAALVVSLSSAVVLWVWTLLILRRLGQYDSWAEATAHVLKAEPILFFAAIALL